jgi:hypothetical protein
METRPENAMAAMLAQEQSSWVQRVREGLHGARRELDCHEGSAEWADGEGYAVIVRAFQHADELLSAMHPNGH